MIIEKPNELIGRGYDGTDYDDGEMVIIDHVQRLIYNGSFRLRKNLLMLCCEGTLSFTLNGERHVLRRGQVLITRPNVAFDRYRLSPDFDSRIFLVSTQCLQSLLREHVEIWNRAVYIHPTHIVSLLEGDAQRYLHYHSILRAELAIEGRTPLRQRIIHSLMAALLLSLCEILRRDQQPAIGTSQGQQRQLFDRFLKLIAESEVKKRPVGHYALQLNVTPKYLTTVCEELSGRPASKWIEQYLLEDIRYYLRETALPVSVVARRLGFPNLSFFGRYTREHLGLSPTKFRASALSAKD